MSESITLLFRHPPPPLSPNARVHFRARAAALRVYRLECWRIASNEVRLLPDVDRVALGLPWPSAIATVSWLVTDLTRRRDEDGCLSSLKAAWDSLEGLIYENDCRLHVVPNYPFFVPTEKRRTGVRVVLTRGVE